MRIFSVTAQEAITLEKITSYNGIVQIPIGDFYGLINDADTDPTIRTRQLTDFFGKIAFLGISYDWQTIYICFDTVPTIDINKAIGTRYIRLYAIITLLNKKELSVTFATNLEALSEKLNTQFITFFKNIFDNFTGQTKWELTATDDTATRKPTTEDRYIKTIAIPAAFKNNALYFTMKEKAIRTTAKGTAL